MPREHTVKFHMALDPEDMDALIKIMGPHIKNTWWYRRWFRRQQSAHTLGEYRALMESPPNREPRPTRDWGEDQ